MDEKLKQKRIEELKGVIEDFALAKWSIFNSSTLAEAIINAGYVRYKSHRHANNMLTYNGQTKRLSDWAREYNLHHNTLYYRLKRNGWSVEEALTIPPITKASGRKKRVNQYDKKGNLVAVFTSGAEAAKAVDVSRVSIYKCCKGDMHTAAGFVWRWADDCGPNEEGHS